MSDQAKTTEEIWKLLSSRLRGFLRQRVSDEQLAEDLLQETFLRIHRRLPQLEDRQRLTSWVFQIARNLVADHYRSQARKAGESLSAEPTSGSNGDENLNEMVSGWLPAMIARLPESYREAVELYELQGLSQQAIAERLQISLSGAKSRVQRGREKLRSLLFECCSFVRDGRGNVIDFERNDRGACNSCDDCE